MGMNQLKKVKPNNELGESPSKALAEAQAEEKKALHKINHTEKNLQEQAQVTKMKAQQMKAVAKAVKSVTMHAEDTVKQTEQDVHTSGELGEKSMEELGQDSPAAES